MCAVQPNNQDPVAYVPWWLDLLRGQPSLLVIAWSDGVYRKTTLRSYAQRAGGTFLECGPHRTRKQFLQWLASECGLFPGRRMSSELYEALLDLFLSRDYLVILDDADQLSVGALGAIRDLHHTIDDHCCHGRDGRTSASTFVLCSGNQELARKLDRIPDFWTYCCWWHYDVPPSKKQRALKRAGR